MQRDDSREGVAATYRASGAEQNGNDYKDSGDEQRTRQGEQVTVIEGNTQVSIVPRESFPRTINLSQAPALPGVQNLQLGQQQQP